MRTRAVAPFLLIPCFIYLSSAACSNNDGSSGGAACDSLSTEAHQERLAIQESAGRACAVDEDCVVVDFLLSCVGRCTTWPAAVARASESDLESGIQQIEETVCSSFSERGCTLVPTPCPGGGTESNPVATCSDGICALQTDDR
jgi:hypothetical protein